MTTAVVILLICLVSVPLLICRLLLRSQDRLIANLKEAVTRLYSDNVKLTEGLVRKHGEYVSLVPEVPKIQATDEAMKEAYERGKTQAPYWQAKIIGNQQ